MNNDKFKKLDVARSYRVKYGAEMPTLKLARIMYNDCPTMFTSVETCRTILRTIEGKNGKRLCDRMKETEFFMEEERPRNPYNLPQSFEKVREPYILPPECNNILYGSDHHFPYQNNAAIEAWMQFGVENNVNCIFLNGDLMDFHQISRHEKDPRKRSVKQEFEATDQFLSSLRKTFPEAHIYWLKGNHCYVEGTEALTKNGWKTFESLLVSDEVAQFDSENKISFSIPKSILSREYSGNLYDIEHNYSRQVVTDLHDVVVGGRKKKAKDVSIEDVKSISGCGFLNAEDYDISDSLLKFLVYLVCDGCIVVDKEKGDKKIRFQFKLSKERKIEALKSILDEAEIPYTFKECKKGGINKLQPYYIRIYKREIVKAIYDLLEGKKRFPEFFTHLSERQANIVIGEIAATDGFIQDGSISWTSTSEHDIDLIQRMCVLNNINSQKKNLPLNASGFKNALPQFRLKIRSGILPQNLNKKIETSFYDGKVYCVEMPLGTVITRYKGRPALSGNCIRWEKFLLMKAHEIWDDSYFYLEQRLNLNQKKITMIDDKLMVMAGKLMITHGHVLTAAGKNPAEKALNKAGQSVVMGHLHRYDYFERTTAHKETKQQAWVIPCLCELQPDYNVLSNSQHGFAHIRVKDNGDFSLKPYIIENGIIQ